MSDTATAVPAPTAAVSSRYSRGLLFALAGAFLYSWKPLWVKLLYGYGIDADTQLALRMLIALPFYAGFALYTFRERQRAGLITDLGFKAVGLAMLTGLLGNYLAPYLDFVGLKYVTAEFERLILFTYPTFVALIAWWSFRDRPSMALVASLALTYAGLTLIFVKDLSSFGPQVATGTALVMGCSVAYAFYMAWSKWPIARMGSQLFTSLSMLSATVALVAQFAFRHPFSALSVPGPAMAYAVAMAIGSTVLPSFLVAEAIARMGPGPASVTGGAGPIITTLLAVLLLGEPLTAWHVAGMALVIAGVMVLSRRRV
jgi:drug/metabolite transporter (DMT)-like permease